MPKINGKSLTRQQKLKETLKPGSPDKEETLKIMDATQKTLRSVHDSLSSLPPTALQFPSLTNTACDPKDDMPTTSTLQKLPGQGDFSLAQTHALSKLSPFHRNDSIVQARVPSLFDPNTSKRSVPINAEDEANVDSLLARSRKEQQSLKQLVEDGKGIFQANLEGIKGVKQIGFLPKEFGSKLNQHSHELTQRQLSPSVNQSILDAITSKASPKRATKFHYSPSSAPQQEENVFEQISARILRDKLAETNRALKESVSGLGRNRRQTVSLAPKAGQGLLT